MVERIRFSSRRSSMLPWLAMAIVMVLLDQLSKIAIAKTFAYGESHAILPFFNLVLVYNKGAAFSFMASQAGWQRYFFAGLSAATALFILYLLKRHAHQRMFSFALTLILGGAVGNLIDRLMYGYVIDFLDFHVAGWHWPAFNVADSVICIGAALYVLDELRRARTRQFD